MTTETILILIVVILLIGSVSNQFWRRDPNAPELPALQFGGLVNLLLYVILVIVLVKLVLQIPGLF
jgi:hypothetical protein